MKKYKLIKEYPGSPNLGTIVEYKDDQYELYLIEGKTPNYGQFPKPYVEDLPEFWEEIKDKYQILSFVNSDNTIFKIQLNGLYKDESVGWDYGFEEGWRTLNHILTEAIDCKIYSVKRLSDNVIFTIGDYIRDYPNPTKITQFTIDKSWGGGLRVGYKNGGTAITAISKVSPPLFTTEDGVDIYDKNYYPIHHLGINGNNKNYIYADRAEYISNNPRMCFAFKENAEEYVLKNEPCLSINDIINTCKAYITPDLEASLKRIVKQKLNK